MCHTDSPLVPSRSLGSLLGLGSLHFKLETCQPTGSWLDRSAARLVASASSAEATGLILLGVDACALPLAVQCARAGLRLVILKPAGVSPVPEPPLPRMGEGETGSRLPLPPVRERGTGGEGWLAALGARTVAVEASLGELRQAVLSILPGTGWRLVDASDPLLGSGLEAIVREVERAHQGERLIAVPRLTGREARWLTALAADRRTATAPMPLDDLPAPAGVRSFAVVGDPGGHDLDAWPAADPDAQEAGSEIVLSVQLTPRDADAARRLLAREEGLLVSPRGASGLAALIRAVRADRARRPRERQLRLEAGAVVVLTGAPPGCGDGPPPSPDALPLRTVTLDQVRAGLERLLIEPPGR